MNKEIKDKKVVILGLGVEGLSTLKYFSTHGAVVSVRDQKIEGEIDPEILVEAKKHTSNFIFGSDYLSNLFTYDVICRSPGVRPDLPEISGAIAKGVVLTSNMKTFFDFSPARIIGVTGTKGKGTTTALVGEMLRVAGKKVFVGGNIGNPPLDFLDELGESDWVVLELSSFQLMDMEKSPHVAVVLMTTTEHLDWHQDDIEYRIAKYNIVSHQKYGDYAAINFDYPASRVFADHTKADVIFFSLKKEPNPGVFYKEDKIWSRLNSMYEEVIERKEILLPGVHNVENALAAISVASILGVNIENIKEVLRGFKGLEHRLELVREVGGVSFYNDSFSTTPETAIAAIKSFGEGEILILGGSSKKSDFTSLAKEIVSRKNLKAIILIGEEAPRIKEAINKRGSFKGKIIEEAKNMKEMVYSALSEAKTGNVVLLSPACASFDMFKNYKDRGMQFKEIVNSLPSDLKLNKEVSW